MLMLWAPKLWVKNLRPRPMFMFRKMPPHRKRADKSLALVIQALEEWPTKLWNCQNLKITSINWLQMRIAYQKGQKKMRIQTLGRMKPLERLMMTRSLKSILAVSNLWTRTMWQAPTLRNTRKISQHMKLAGRSQTSFKSIETQGTRSMQRAVWASYATKHRSVNTSSLGTSFIMRFHLMMPDGRIL